jgi:hypothetical protein
MIRCLFNGPKKLEDSQGGSSVRGGFRDRPMRFIFENNHLEETHLVKISITDIRQTLHHAVKIPWQVGILEFSKNSSKRKLWHSRQIQLNCDQQTKIVNLRLFWGKSDDELNTTVKENFLRFLMVSCTPSYDKRFRSYVILKLTGLLNIRCTPSYDQRFRSYVILMSIGLLEFLLHTLIRSTV